MLPIESAREFLEKMKSLISDKLYQNCKDFLAQGSLLTKEFECITGIEESIRFDWNFSNSPFRDSTSISIRILEDEIQLIIEQWNYYSGKHTGIMNLNISLLSIEIVWMLINHYCALTKNDN